MKLKGTPIPENDIWIAAIAMQFELLLVTRDKHFDKIERIIIEKW
ncbi:MAG: tRNA(fMet)-specific endonuclease VapC [Saprospiraceae bacterium]